jgi:PGF-pre-PGF domain-containing protein
VRHTYVLFGLIGLLLVALVAAQLGPNVALQTPADHTVKHTTENLTISVTFPGLADITLRVNNTDNATGTFQTINTTTDHASPYAFSWNASNGSFSDGRYNITVLVVNATNASDSALVVITNITIDNTPPRIENLSVANVTYNGTSYVNATPIFRVNFSDGLAGIGACQLSENATEPYAGPTTVVGTTAGSCTYALGTQFDGRVFNVSFFVNDTAGNANTTARQAFVVDSSPPVLAFVNPAIIRYRVGDAIIVTANATDAGAQVANGTACNVTLVSASTTNVGTINYTNTTATCDGSLIIPSVADGLYNLTVSVNDSLGNRNLTRLAITIDSTAPAITNLSFLPRNPQNTTTQVNLTLNASDVHNVSAVLLTNGTDSLPLALVQGDNTTGRYTLLFNLSDLGCAEETVCALNISINDTLGNTNTSVTTALLPYLLYADSYSPVLVRNSSNVSTARVGDVVLFSARWLEVAQLDNVGLSAILHVYNHTASAFQHGNTSLALQGHFGTITANETNLTMTVPRAYEGTSFIGYIALNDTRSHTNRTENLTIIIQNETPSLSIEYANDTIIAHNTSIRFTILERGGGIDLSALVINLTGASNLTIRYATNTSLFNCSCADCGTNYSAGVENTTCRVETSWSLTTANATWSVMDYVGNAFTLSTRLNFTNASVSIVNITVDGISLDTALGAINVTADDPLIEFNWSVDSALALSNTAITLRNTSTPAPQTLASLPANASYTLAAGRHYLQINATMTPVSFTAMTRFNLSLNVPVNMTAVRALYTAGHGFITDWNASEDATGIPLFGTARVNTTLTIGVAVENATAPTPFSATLRYAGSDGLLFRWNETENAFNLSAETAGNITAWSAAIAGNITASVRSTGSPSLFFDTAAPLISMTFNLSSANRTAYWYDKSAASLSQIANCTSIPTSAVSSACVSGTSANSTVYLPSFDTYDSVLIAEPSAAYPPLVAILNTTSSQSNLPLRIDVTTGFPNATFCAYNITYQNSSGTIFPFQTGTLPSSSFFTTGAALRNVSNISAADRSYNISVSCADIFGTVVTARGNVTVLDTTKPALTNVTVSGVGRRSATVNGMTDEPANYTVSYGTSNTSLSTTVYSDAEMVLSDSILVDDLEESTLYYARLTACDAKNQCNTSALLSFTTTEPATGGSGGGGGAAGGLLSLYEQSDGRVFTNVQPGAIIAYDMKLVFSHLKVLFNTTTQSVKITVRQFKQKPSSVTALPTVYKYLVVEHVGLEGASDIRVTYTVPRAWMEANRLRPEEVSLYRYEGASWVSYPAAPEPNGTDYRYTVRLPGFSFFAIGSMKASANTTIAPPTTPNPAAPDVIAPPADASPEGVIEPNKEGPTFVSGLDHEESSGGLGSIIWIALAVVLVTLGTVVGLQQYKQSQQREAERQQQLKIEGDRARQQKLAEQAARMQRPEGMDPMAALHSYIGRMRAKGKTDKEIQDALVGVGWDDVVVFMELQRK